MKKAYSTYLMTTDNIGDEKLSPGDYFDFPIEVEKLCIHECFEPSLNLMESFIIFGGGGLVHSPGPDYDGGRMRYLEDFCKLSPYKVSWGVGHNIHTINKIVYPHYFINSFRLHGVRDWNQDVLPWVPCVSCMHEAFDHEYDIRRTFSVTGHNFERAPSLDKLPKMSPSGANFEDYIEFLATGEYVITNSYHGAYWGALLGKRVVIYEPFSSKHFFMFDNIVVASPDTWEDSLELAEPDDDLLELCRLRNVQHHEDVCLHMEHYLEQ